jgi:hypothetical protein
MVVNRRAAAELYQNVTEDAGNWVSVRLSQDRPNRAAVGAWVELRIGEAVQMQEVTVGGGHVSGRSGPLHFGLGAAEKAELRVLWPDGTASAWQPVSASEEVEVQR